MHRLLFALMFAASCAAEVTVEWKGTIDPGVDGFVTYILVDQNTGARILKTPHSAVVLPPISRAPVSAAPRPPAPEVAPDGMEREETWGDATTIRRLELSGWKVEKVTPGAVHGLERYTVVRPRVKPGQAEKAP